MSEQNKSVIRKIREQAVGRSGADLDILDGLYADGYRYHGGAWGELSGPNAFRGLLEGLSAALEGYSERVVRQVAEGNMVATQISGSGRALADIPGFAAGSEVRGLAASFALFDAEGKIVEEWVYTAESPS